MSPNRKEPTRRAALAGLAGVGVLAAVTQLGTPGEQAALAQQPPRPLQDVVPIKGKAGPGLEPLDAAMLQIMDRHGIPGAALAVARGGKLVLAKGYGWADVARGTPVEPETRFGLASISKSLTAVATLLLVDRGKLRLEDRVFDVIKDINPPRDAQVDPRLGEVTVRQCLDHSGGWDRLKSGDPINWEPQICRAYQARPPLTPAQFISFVMSRPLDFKPGTQQSYSNVGYVLLGEVIARVSGQPYARFVAENVLKPAGVKKAAMNAFDGKYFPGEAVRHLAGTLIGLPAALLPMVDAAGGWTASAVDLARFLTNLDGSRGKPVLSANARKLMLAPPQPPLAKRENGTWFGLGWDAVRVEGDAFTYYKEGSYQGMRTYMKRLPSGVNWVLLYNASMEFDPQDMRLAAGTVQEARRLVDDIKKYPDIDLFKEYE